MKLKVTLKNGDNEKTVQLAGEVDDMVDGVSKFVASVADGLKSLFVEDAP